MIASEPYWGYTVLSLATLLQIILLLIICLFRRKSYQTDVSDESSCLVVGSYRRHEDSPSQTDYDSAYMSLQFYIRGMRKMEYTNSYKSVDPTANTFWFMLHDKSLAKTKNMNRFLSLSSGNCIAKVKQRPNIVASMRNANAIGTALDILLTIKEESCPYISPVFDVKLYEERDSLLIVNEFIPKGSLRDKLLGVKPFHHLTRSVGSKRVECGKALSVDKIFSYTKQILLGLIYLDKLRFPLKKTCLWLHAGNIMIDGSLCKLSGYEVELFKMKTSEDLVNAERAGLLDVGQVVFEMATGFPVNYAENVNLDPSRKQLTLRRKECLRDIHFEYLKVISYPEVLQLVQFLCDVGKCTSLQMAVHHPIFDSIDQFHAADPEDDTTTSLNTLYRSLFSMGSRES